MKKLLLLLPLISVMACGDDNLLAPSRNDDPIVARIEYRVTGNANSMIIRHSNSIDGLTQVQSTLPYTLSFETSRESLFLSLEATPVSFLSTVSPFTIVQIFVNGNLFREASSNSFTATVSVNGTWRN